jgi:hypothetical protein
MEGWSEERAFDPTIRARSEAGYLKTRARTTRVPKKYKVTYSPLPLADKQTIEDFEDTVLIGADSFNWTDPTGGGVKVVRFAEPVKYSALWHKNWWKVEMTLEEV